MIDIPEYDSVPNKPNTDALHHHILTNIITTLSAYKTAIDTEERIEYLMKMLCYVAASSSLQSYHITDNIELINHTKTLLKNIPQT